MTRAQSRGQDRLLLGEIGIGRAQASQGFGVRLLRQRSLDDVVDIGVLHLVGAHAQRRNVCPAARKLVVDTVDVIVVDQLTGDADELVPRLVGLDGAFGIGHRLAQFGQSSRQGGAGLARGIGLDRAHLLDEGCRHQPRQAGRFFRIPGFDRDVDDEALGIAARAQRPAEILQRQKIGGRSRIAAAGARQQIGDEGESRWRLAVELDVVGQVRLVDDPV